MDNNVFITNYAGHDFKKAEKFGVLRPVTKGYVSFGSLDRLKFDISSTLSESRPDDYLLLSGTAIICVVSAIVWFKKHGSVKLLVLDKKSGDYRVLVIDSGSLDKIFEVLAEGTSNASA